MKWSEFKAVFEQHPELELQFRYAENSRVNASYHITEIKQAPITSVDCGGVVNQWTEVIVQLWEPAGQQQERAMKVSKALSIIAIVEKALPLAADAIVKIEFGNAMFDTRQMLPSHIDIQNGELVVDLRPDTVQCKAQDRGGNCGPADDECCALAKPKLQMINLTQANTCTPGGGCC